MVPYFKVPYFKEPQPYPKSEDIYIHSNVLTFRVGLWFLILRFLILRNHNPTLKVKTLYIYSNVLTFRVGLWFLILRNNNPTLKVKISM